mmetsp:Transcript_16697/g.35410  ORF Transcript_16697/g.35410 Transcript_16697/m.35410 type:complete len:138 (+) Transcript_16697:345-758(+)
MEAPNGEAALFSASPSQSGILGSSMQLGRLYTIPTGGGAAGLGEERESCIEDRGGDLALPLLESAGAVATLRREAEEAEAPKKELAVMAIGELPGTSPRSRAAKRANLKRWSREWKSIRLVWLRVSLLKSPLMRKSP